MLSLMDTYDYYDAYRINNNAAYVNYGASITGNGLLDLICDIRNKEFKGELSVYEENELDSISYMENYVIGTYQSGWINDLFDLSNKGLTGSASKLVFRTSIHINSTKAYEQLSEELSAIDLSGLPNVILLSLLRNTSSFKEKLSYWNDLFNKVEKILLIRDENTNIKSLFHGLKDF